MSLLGKILIVIQAILALLFLGVQGTLYYHTNDWRTAYERTTKRYKKVVEGKNEQVRQLEGDLSERDKALRTARETVSLYKGEIKHLEDKVKDEANAKKDLRGDYDELKRSHQTIVGTIQEKDSQISEYLDRISQLEDNLKEATQNQELAEAQVARLLQQRTALEKDLAEAREAYVKANQKALDQQLVLEELKRQGIPVTSVVGNFPPPPPIRGKVAGVDASVQPSLVLLTVGADDGVKRGYTFTVYRGSQFVGKVLVSRLMADSCGCRVLFTAPGQSIQQGDNAATVLD